jgi:predicted nucleotidyltransferase
MDCAEQVIDRVSSALRDVPGIDAVVIGGSRATGHATPQSDIDIGIYYGAAAPLDMYVLNRVAQQLDDNQRTQLVAPFGAWGPWVNAGAWLVINGLHVDLILRETQRVAQVITECESGRISVHYQPGHPHAYINVMYMGELALCRVLWAANAQVSLLKTRAEHYPDALQRALIDLFGFEARFSCDLATKTIPRDDPYYVVAHCIRAISALHQVIFARNRQYIINEKKAVVRVMQCAIRPHAYQDRVRTIMHTIGISPNRACAELSLLIDETMQHTSAQT